MATGPNVPITATDYTAAAWKSATENAKGFQKTMSVVNAAVGGFGAMQFISKMSGVTRSIAEGALGLGDFILEAEKAGAALDTVILEDARALSSEVENFKTAMYEAGANLAGPFLDDIRNALAGVRSFFQENMDMIKRMAGAARETMSDMRNFNLLDVGNIGKTLYVGARETYGALAAGASVGGSTVSDEERKRRQKASGSGSDDAWADDSFFTESGIKQEKARVERIEAKNAADLQRDRDHAERKRAQERAEYERDTERRVEQEKQADEKRTQKELTELEQQRTHADALLEQFTFTREQRFEAVNIWEQRELQAVGSNQAAITRITQQGERMRSSIIQNEQATRARNRQRDVSAGLSLLGVAFGKNKGFALAEAAINMWTGATAELRSPAPGKFARVAMVIASGMKSIMAIKSTNADSSGGGSVGTGGGGGGGGDFGSVPTGGYQAEGNAIAPAKVQPRGTVEVHFTGNVMLPEFTREHILPEIRSAVGDNYDLKIFDERGVARTRSG